MANEDSTPTGDGPLVFHRPDDDSEIDTTAETDGEIAGLAQAMREAVQPMTFRQKVEAALASAQRVKGEADVMFAAADRTAEEAARHHAEADVMREAASRTAAEADMQVHALEDLLEEIS